MTPSDLFSVQGLRHAGSFQFIKPDEYKSLGIDPSDIPAGTIAALNHPSQLLSRFGGNAYGFGLVEAYERLDPKDIEVVQDVMSRGRGIIKESFKDINKVYKKIGLLIRFSSNGKPYYLIPVHLISNSLTHVKVKVNEISKIVGFHRKKYFKENYEIGIWTYQDDLILHELSYRFKEHRFVGIDSLEKLREMKQTLDLFILTGDIYEIILTTGFGPVFQERPSKKRLDQYAHYFLMKIYELLKPDGEIFIVARRQAARTNRVTKLVFKDSQEEKNFILFSHIFRTKKRYRSKNHSINVNIFDLHNYLSGFYVEQEVVDELLGGRRLEDMTIDEINDLPYMDFQLAVPPVSGDQEKSWDMLCSPYFEKIFLKPLIPTSLKSNWETRFTCIDYSPDYMLIYLGQKRRLTFSVHKIREEVERSNLIGCPVKLLADYRNSFEYVIHTLQVLDRLRKGHHSRLPQIFIDRLRLPLEHKNRRFSNLNDVLKLLNRIKQLERIARYINPDGIEGARTRILDHIEMLGLFGFGPNELREVLFIVLGHTAIERVISGKMSEKALKPVSDMAATYDLGTALNLLRYLRLMSMAETEAARGKGLTREELAQLFNLYELMVRVVMTQDLDWERVLDENIIAMGGIHNKIIRKLLMMINHFEFLDNWSELRQKGRREKESLADYDDTKLHRIENVIKMVKTTEIFEQMHLQSDPLQLPAFYRKLLNMEFHGTGRLFERMDSRNVFVLLWITVNVARGEIVNFNPMLESFDGDDKKQVLKKLEQDVWRINIKNLDVDALNRFSEQLYLDGTAFIVGSGFKLSVDPDSYALTISFLDVEKDLNRMEALSKKMIGSPISMISLVDIRELNQLFSDLESFYVSHLKLVERKDMAENIPSRQKIWFKKVVKLREQLREGFLNEIFRPETFYTDLELLYENAPSLLNFFLPEFKALQGVDLSWHLYMRSPIIHYILATTKKLQALIRHDRESFQDIHYLHGLAKREFGPMATGIVGVNELQIDELEKIVERLSHNSPLFDALVKSFVFQDIGRVSNLRTKYKDIINPADLGDAGAFFLEKEEFAERFHLDEEGKSYLIFLVRHHSLLHHIIRGEFSFYAIRNVLEPLDKDLFDAFFVFSFIMLCAIREDLILEDLAGRMFQTKKVCDRIINGENTLESHLDKIFIRKGRAFHAMQKCLSEGIPPDITPVDYLKSWDGEDIGKAEQISAGSMIFAMERIFRLRGIRYVEFLDLAYLLLKVPLKFIYRKRNFSSVGYATFEKELFEAFRIYNTIQHLPEEVRHFILNGLVGDKVRIFGYEKVSGYLNYENQIKLLLIVLLGADEFTEKGSPVFLNFLDLCVKIERRYEAVNDHLNKLSVDRIWENRGLENHFSSINAGVFLKKMPFPNVLTIDFSDRIDISKKISYMKTINNTEQLKNYYHYSLRSLRKSPFYTDDYEEKLEDAFEKRLAEITDMLLAQAEKQINMAKDFKELHGLVTALVEQSVEIELSEDQRHRLNDLYEVKRDSLKREVMTEIMGILETINDINELNDYWNSLKWYLQENRRFLGKEFEDLIARRFDNIERLMERVGRDPIALS